MTVLLDGAPPPAEATRAHAGTLAFEMSAGRERLVVNAGPGRDFGGDWALLARQTAAHSTVEVDGRSSARRRGRPRGAHLRAAAGRRAGARLGPAGAGRHRAVAARDAGRLRREPRPAAGAAAVRRRARAGAARRGHPDRGRRPGPRPVRARTRAAGGSASRRASTCTRACGRSSTRARQIVLLTLALGRGLAVPRRRRVGRPRGVGLLRPGRAGAAADDAGGCPRRGGRVSRPGHLVDRPDRRARA